MKDLAYNEPALRQTAFPGRKQPERTKYKDYWRRRMFHTERQRQSWDALDKAAVIGLILLNVVIMLTLYTNMTYFYLDSPELNELLEMHTVFYKWFVPVQRFIPMYHMVAS